MNKILTPNQLQATAEQWRRENMKIVFTNGCFDLLHAGHLHTFREARKLGDLLIVGVNSDRSIRLLKGPNRPLIGEHDRVELVAALEPVSFATIFDELTAERLLTIVQPHVYVKGGDYRIETLPEYDTLIRLRCQTVFIPLTEGISTTELVRRIALAYRPGDINCLS